MEGLCDWLTILKYVSDPLKKKLADPDLNKNKGVKRKLDKQVKTCQVWGKSKASQVKWNCKIQVVKSKKNI